MTPDDSVSTTRGPISPAQLGFTLMHEHVAIYSPGLPEAFPHLYDHEAILRDITRILVDARSAGIDTIVDVTTVDLGRNPEIVIRAAAAADIHVVLCTGIWVDVPRFIRGRGPDDAAELFVLEIEKGIEQTGVRAGIIKVASDETITDAEEIVLRAAARAARATGVPVTTHSWPADASGLRQTEILREEGLPVDRFVVGHSSTTDSAYLERLYGTGCSVGWDNFAYVGMPGMGELEPLLDTLADFVVRYPSQTVLSNDSSAYADWEPPGPEYTYRNVPDVVLPALRARGVSDEVINQVTIGNPARILARSAPASSEGATR